MWLTLQHGVRGRADGARTPWGWLLSSLGSVPLQLLQVRRVPLGAQVEVGEDAGGPVLLGHEQQHLVVDEVAVLLERASQAQLQGLADLFGSDALQVTGLQHLPQLGPDRLLHLLLF